MICRTSRFTIRHFVDTDAASIAGYANNIRIWRNLRDVFPHPYSETDARDFIRQVLDGQFSHAFAIEIQDRAAGTVSLLIKNDVYAHTAELGYWLAEPFWNQGIMSDVIGEVILWGFNTLDIVRIEAEVFETNPASMRVLEKNGFRCEGRLRKRVAKAGRILDAFLYALIGEDAGFQSRTV
jgi:ribosomal-protein-alanine N-acetyltransferase